MTDSNSDRPLTRRELRALERAAEEAAKTPSQAEDASEHADAAPVAEQQVEALAEPVQAEVAETVEVDVEELFADDADDATAVADTSDSDGANSGAVDDELAPTQAADLSELFGESGPVPVVEQKPQRPGRFFGRRVEEAQETADDIPFEVELDEAVSVPAPSLATRTGSISLDDIQDLDRVSDDEVDGMEIDEVQVQQRPVSALRASELTPAELEDRRQREAEDDSGLAGPTRGSASRLPFVVNVVQDTSEHHIADLRAHAEQIERQNVGTGTSSITANALVLPAGSADDQITIESEDGVLVTGSIDLPDGFASSGRGRGSFDSADLDTAPDDSEVSNPETAPVRASKAVSSYANARVKIAPQRHRRSAWPIAIGVGAGVVAVGIGVVTVGALSGWF